MGIFNSMSVTHPLLFIKGLGSQDSRTVPVESRSSPQILHLKLSQLIVYFFRLLRFQNVCKDGRIKGSTFSSVEVLASSQACSDLECSNVLL